MGTLTSLWASSRVDPETVVAFRVPKGTFVHTQPGVLHGRQFVVDSPGVNILSPPRAHLQQRLHLLPLEGRGADPRTL